MSVFVCLDLFIQTALYVGFINYEVIYGKVDLFRYD